MIDYKDMYFKMLLASEKGIQILIKSNKSVKKFTLILSVRAELNFYYTRHKRKHGAGMIPVSCLLFSLF